MTYDRSNRIFWKLERKIYIKFSDILISDPLADRHYIDFFSKETDINKTNIEVGISQNIITQIDISEEEFLALSMRYL